MGLLLIFAKTLRIRLLNRAETIVVPSRLRAAPASVDFTQNRADSARGHEAPSPLCPLLQREWRFAVVFDVC